MYNFRMDSILGCSIPESTCMQHWWTCRFPYVTFVWPCEMFHIFRSRDNVNSDCNIAQINPQHFHYITLKLHATIRIYYTENYTVQKRCTLLDHCTLTQMLNDPSFVVVIMFTDTVILHKSIHNSNHNCCTVKTILPLCSIWFLVVTNNIHAHWLKLQTKGNCLLPICN